jgi:hypothetical protein
MKTLESFSNTPLRRNHPHLPLRGDERGVFFYSSGASLLSVYKDKPQGGACRRLRRTPPCIYLSSWPDIPRKELFSARAILFVTASVAKQSPTEYMKNLQQEIASSQTPRNDVPQDYSLLVYGSSSNHHLTQNI